MKIAFAEYQTGTPLFLEDLQQRNEDVVNNPLKVKVCNNDAQSIQIKEVIVEHAQLFIVEVSSSTELSFSIPASLHSVSMLFCMGGQVSYMVRAGEKSSILKANQHTVFSNTVHDLSGKVLKQATFIVMVFKTAYFEELTGQTFSATEVDSMVLMTSKEMQIPLKAIFEQELTGRLMHAFLHSKVLELAVIYLQQKTQGIVHTLKSADVDKIEMAKKIVEANLQTPLSLMELARKVGINDFKLKKGFKELTGTTVFGYLYNLRMEKAYTLLAIEKKAVNEVSFLVGYKNSQHFILAFKKKHNFLPGTLNK
ncbi:helix-turn-helix transcriptional regulator [Pedobacter sp. MW01-1-1]|uniref:helix-turn-helix transcriptional regulator n=1 Tax=Pedobacter sp. MW01-1-1 TaxID=3383027 RepID=UPI003FF0D924